MIIGVNTRFLLKHKMEGFGWFTFETISRIVQRYPEHQFIFFFDRAFDTKFVFADNVTPVVVYPPARHPILFKIWFDYALPKQLKKYKCEAFISPDGFVSLKTKLPQLAVIHDLNFEHNPMDIPSSARKYLCNYFPKFAQKAKRICTVSNYSKQDIINTYGVSASKIDVTYNGASPLFQPIPETEKFITQKKYTQERPYVLFVGAIHKRKNLQRLIDAFERLKKETDLPHCLLIVGEPLFSKKNIIIPKTLDEHLFFTGHISLENLAKITASADLLAFVSYFEGFGIPMVEAMQSGTCVLAGNKTSLPEIGANAAHYCDPFDINSIYHEMTYLLKHPSVREKYVQKGLLRANEFSWEQTADKLWDSFRKMMKVENEIND